MSQQTNKPEELRRKSHDAVRSVFERMVNVSDFAMEVWIENGRMLGRSVRIVCESEDYKPDAEFTS